MARELKEKIALWLMVRDGYNDDWYFDNYRDKPNENDFIGVSLNQYLLEAEKFIEECLGKEVK